MAVDYRELDGKTLGKLNVEIGEKRMRESSHFFFFQSCRVSGKFFFWGGWGGMNEK